MMQKEIRQVSTWVQQKAVCSRKRIRFSPSFAAALAGALSFGLLAQGMGLFNKFSWHDDIFSLFMTGTAIESGRWMLYVLSELEKWFYGNGYFSLPVVNGSIAILCIGLSAGLMTDFFHIRSRKLSALLGGVMAVFPVVTSLFNFMFTIHYYMLGLLMLTAGSILICRDGTRWKKWAGILLCGCSIGIYQAFIPVMLMMVLLDQIMVFPRWGEKMGQLLLRLLIRALCVAAVMGVYLAGSRYFLSIKNLRIDSYLGMDQAVSVPLGQYLQRAGRAYREFFQPSHFVLWDMYPQAMFNVYRIMLCMDFLLGGLSLFQVWKKSPPRALLLAGLFALVPLGCNFIFVMSEEVHSLMVYGQVMQIVFLLCLVSLIEEPYPVIHRIVSLGMGILLAASCVMYIRYDNQCYMKTAFHQQEAISWNTTLVTRIESTEGFRDEMPVAFVNRRNMDDKNLYNLDELDFLSLGTYDENIREYLNDWAWEAFLARWCGFQPKMVDPREMEHLREVEAMPHYPDDGSIRIIEDVIVVRF